MHLDREVKFRLAVASGGTLAFLSEPMALAVS